MVNWRFWGRGRSTPPAPPVPRRPVYPNSAGQDGAERLLWSKLTDTQRAAYPYGYFEVNGSLGGLYRIYTHTAIQNITRPGNGVDEFCMGLSGAVYRPQIWLAQKILIECDEGQFLRTAVHYRGGARQYAYNPRYEIL